MAETHSLESVRAVLEAHRAELTQRCSAVGTGIGRPDPSGPYVITVYVADPADVPPDPGAIDGVPLRFEVTGSFHARSN